MRVIQTFIVRVVADNAAPDALRGVVHPVAGAQAYHFADETELMALLRDLVQHVPGREDAPFSCQRSDDS